MAKAAGGDPTRVRRISRLAVLTFLFTLLAACWWGQGLLDLFVIRLDSFRVAGGLILLAGPGAISLVIADAPAPWQGRLALSAVIALLAIGIYLLLLVSMPLRRALGELQEKVISRLMGLLLSAIAVAGERPEGMLCSAGLCRTDPRGRGPGEPSPALPSADRPTRQRQDPLGLELAPLLNQ